MIKSFSIYVAVCVITSIHSEENREECSLKWECGQGNISQYICKRRGCCYDASPDRLNTCYSNIPTTDTQPRQRTTPKQVYPDGAIHLSDEMKEGLLDSENRTEVEVVKLINKYEEYIKNFTIISEVDWTFEFKDYIKTQVRVSPETLLDRWDFNTGTSVQIQQSWGTTKNGTIANITAAVITEYPQLIKVFMKEQTKCEVNRDELYMEESPVISVKAYDEDWNVLSVPVIYTANGLNTTQFDDQVKGNLSCTFLKEDRSAHEWFTDGCKVKSHSNTSITCFCNHTTKFSMLFVIAPLDFPIQSQHNQYISILEYCMEGLSLFCLIVTFFVLTLVQRRRSKGTSISGMRAEERTAVHTNFVVSLGFLHLTRLFSELATQNNIACTVIAILSHYFTISSGMWMLIEGALLYLNVIVRSMKNTALGIHKYWTGWGIPAVVVVVSATIGLTTDGYISKTVEDVEECIDDVIISPVIHSNNLHIAYCWLTHDNYMIWSAAGPLLVIFLFNVFILAHTVVFIWRLNRKTGAMKPANYSNDSKYFWTTAKSIFVLFPILGVPWLIGFLVNTPSPVLNLVFQYLHIILNGLQGFFIFILYCVVNRESRGIVSRVASSRWDQHRMSISMSNTFGRSTSGSRRRGRRKSVSSSQMGGSDQNATGTPINVTRMGSQYSVYTASMNRKQSLGSASTSISGCAHRINRAISGTSDSTVHRKSGKHFRSRCSISLPRMDQKESHIFLKRSGSVSGISSMDRKTHKAYEFERDICKACKGGHCVHATSDVAGLREEQVDNTEPILLGYKRRSSLDSIYLSPPPITETYQQNRRPRRMTAEEFKRFSAIPEEKRRSGINSMVSSGSKEHIMHKICTISPTRQIETEIKVAEEQTPQIEVLAEVVGENVKDKSTEYLVLTASNAQSATTQKRVKDGNRSKKFKSRKRNATTSFTNISESGRTTSKKSTG